MQTFDNAIPIQSLNSESAPPVDEKKLVSIVSGWRTKFRKTRPTKEAVWTDCWKLFRGKEDWEGKDEWQSTIVLPKAAASVELATSSIKRLVSTAKNPWYHEPINVNDPVATLTAANMTKLTKVVMENANWLEAFATALKTSFIIGVGVLKCWWAEEERQSLQRNPGGFSQVSQSNGRLFVQAVDPYNFYWLPSSTPNRLTGTLEEMWVPKWELMEMARLGVFDEEKVKGLMPNRSKKVQDHSLVRFDEIGQNEGIDEDTGPIKLSEYYGPIVIDNQLVEKNGYILVGNDTTLLKVGKNTSWVPRPPYVLFSPLSIPFRTDGYGIVELVRDVLRGLNKVTNMSVDTITYSLLNAYEVDMDMFANKEEFKTGLIPGKIFTREKPLQAGPGILPIKFNDISGGAIGVAGTLDRSYQEGAFISEVMQGIPRYRGVQTAAEIETKATNQQDFFAGLAASIEDNAIKPLVEMASDLIVQYLVTSTDPSVAAVLGQDASILQSQNRAQLMELVVGDYKVKVRAISDQIEKSEKLGALVQLMNIIGQNPQAWLPYINQDSLLRNIVDCFRPAIDNVDDIVVDRATAEARQQSMIAQQEIDPALIQMLPQLLQQQSQNQLQQQQLALQAQQAAADTNLRQQQLALDAATAQQSAQQPAEGASA